MGSVNFGPLETEKNVIAFNAVLKSRGAGGYRLGLKVSADQDLWLTVTLEHDVAHKIISLLELGLKEGHFVDQA